MGEMLMSNPDNSLSPTSPVNQTKLSDPDNGEFQLIQDDGDFFDPDNTSSQNQLNFQNIIQQDDPSLITQEDFENKYMDENRFIELSKQQEKEEKMSLKNNQSALKPLTSIKRPSFFGKDLQELYKDLRTGSEDKTTDSSSLQSYKTQKLQINDLQEENEDDEEEQEEQQKEQNQKKEENKQIQKQKINKDQQNNYENQGEENQEQQKQSQSNSQQNYEICDENNYSYLSSSNSQSNQDIISFSLNSDLNNKSRNKSQLQNRNSGKSDDFKKNNNNNNGGTYKEDPISEKKAKEEEDQEQENEEISSIDKKNNGQYNNINTQNFGQKNIKDKEKSTDKSDDIENELEQLDIDDPENNIEFNITNSQEEIKKKQFQNQDQDQNQKQNQQKQQQQLENEQQNENEEDEIGNCELDENGLPILKIIDTKYLKQQKQKKKQQNQQLMKQNQQSGRKQNKMELTLSYELNSDSENDANNNDLRSDSSQECSPLGANEKNEQYFQGQIKQQNNQNSIDKSASASEVKQAYYKLAKEFHPDTSEHANANEIFSNISQAYEVLSDQNKRKLYDSCGVEEDEINESYSSESQQFKHRQRRQQNRQQDQEDLFNEFDTFFKQKQRQKVHPPQKGADIHQQVTLGFQDSISQKTKVKLKFEKTVQCPECRGNKCAKNTFPSKCYTCGGSGILTYRDRFDTIDSVCDNCEGYGKVIKHKCSCCKGEGSIKIQQQEEISIPQGIENGQILRKQGDGNVGIEGGKNGDLFIKVTVKQDPYFTRQGNNIFTDFYITPAQSIIGGAVNVKTLHGDIEIQIPKNCYHGQKIQIPNKGLQILNKKFQGDHFVTFKIQIPQTLTMEEKQIYQQIFELEKKIEKSQNQNKENQQYQNAQQNAQDSQQQQQNKSYQQEAQI
ncbi:HSP40/DnaJ peptide-binding [Pseudocohnilembus persalinus]|uniref:HSP40/DnaJ peptide-binding n=1 Tax=Pseudocohnilembus persalinus TaxID=266149 RepID=A0A0V0QQD1_PSEPJ|nr:HSP40/DnaJ peptide-binding [Pseudocohnilembus persalinus]|eukprot:KRX04489.1 HSP40/DnaJ peptide-binding [Pseudocohnilembus persalinus]